MDYRQLGQYGLMLSQFGLDARATAVAGLARSEARDQLALAVEHGFNHFHSRNALPDIEAQQLLGELIADLHLPRDSYCLASQVGGWRQQPPWPTQRGLSRKALRDACDQSLRRLGCDYVDLLVCEHLDEASPVAEIIAALADLISQGKILYWVAADWPAPRLASALSLCQSAAITPLAIQSQTRSPATDVVRLAECHGLGQIAVGTAVAGAKAADLHTVLLPLNGDLSAISGSN